MEVFANEGYRGSRVREICERAGANIAAVNYHFGDKRGLYREVLSHAFDGLGGPDPTDWGIPDGLPAEEKLRGFVRFLLHQLCAEEGNAPQARLIAQEIMDPSDALESLVDEGLRPQVAFVARVLGEISGARADPGRVMRCVASILGQCLFYYYAHAALHHLPMEALESANLDELAEHITRFSLAGLAAGEGP